MKFCPVCGNRLTSKLIDGANRLACIDEAWPEGTYSLITGYLEQNENPENAVLREVKEELGLDGHVHRFFGNYIFSEKNQLIIAYEVHATGDLELNHELAEIKYLTRDELLQYDFHPLHITGKIIRDWWNHEQI